MGSDCISSRSLLIILLYLEACKANDGTTGVDMIVVTLTGPEIKGAGQLAPKTTHVKTIRVLNNTRIIQRYTQRL